MNRAQKAMFAIILIATLAALASINVFNRYKPLPFVDKFLVSLFVVVFSFCALYAVFGFCRLETYWRAVFGYGINMAKQNVKTYGVLIAASAYVTIKTAGLPIDFTVKALLMGFSFLAMNWAGNNSVELRNYANTIAKKTGIVLIALWASFTLVGNRCFVYPIDMNFSMKSFAVFFITAIWMLPIVLWLVHAIDCASEKFAPKNNGLPARIAIVCVLIIFIGAFYYIRAFNPCISSPDTNFCMYHAVNSIKGIQNWHPPFYILILKAIVRIVPSVTAVVVWQYAFFAYVYIRGMALLYKKGIPEKWIIAATVFTVLNCGNMVHFTTVWKDIPCAISLLWLTTIIAYLLSDKASIGFLYLELVVALVFVCYVRQNGVAPYLMSCVTLLAVFRKNKKVWASVLLTVFLVLLIRFPLYRHINIQKSDGGMYVGLGQDIMGAYYNGGKLSEDALDIVKALAKTNKTDIDSYKYTPYRYGAYNARGLEIKPHRFVLAYIKTFARNPLLMTRALICRQDAVWDIFIGQDGVLGVVGYTRTMDNDKRWVELWPERKNNFITGKVGQWVDFSVSNSILNAIEWRTGIWFLLGVVCFSVLCWKKADKKFALLFVPYFGHIISLVLSTGWPDYRYYWPVNLMTLFLFLWTLTIRSGEKAQ